MGIDAKDVGTFFWKILSFSTNIVYTYARKHPVISGVSAVIFLLYTFLPRLFYFLLYSSPLIAFSAFYFRNHLVFKFLNVNKENNGLSPFAQKRSEEGRRKAELKQQRSVRRNARRKVEEVGKDWDSSQASEDERDKVILTTLYGELPDTDKSPKLRKFKKERAFLVSEDFSFDPGLDDDTPPTTETMSVVDPLKREMNGGGETEVECSSSSEGEEETTREDKKVVAWTEDDQKNLMDLGNSDIERNKRLEHLITRRRTRRLFQLVVERSLMDMEVPSICVGRNYFGLDQENNILDELEVPESAPSVLLPTKNPFDLPYDPLEEKPNLSGDSFQQEFAANPNDIFFCRHESFCRRVFPSENQLDLKWEPWKKPIDGWPRPQQGSNDRLVGEKQALTKGKDLNLSEANDMESADRTEIVRSDSNSLLSPGEREMNSNVSNEADSSGIFVKRNDDHHVGNPLAGLIPRKTGSLSSSLAAERQVYIENFGYSFTRTGHKMTQSVESDLQVEISEIGSPPTITDVNNSSDDEKSQCVYESETGKKTGFSGEENEAEENSVVDRTAESQMSPEEKVDQDYNETSSMNSSAEDVSGKDGTDVSGRCEEEETSKSRDFLLDNSDKGLHISAEATVPQTNEVISNREEMQEQLENSTDEMKISSDSNEPEPPMTRTNEDAKDVCGICEEENSSKSRDLLLEDSDRGLHISEEATVPDANEVVLKREVCQELQEQLENSTAEMKISYDSDEPEPSTKTGANEEPEEHLEGNDGDQSTQEMQELVEPEVSDVNNVTSNGSPKSVLPSDQTYTVTSESLEHTSDSQPQQV